MMTTTAAWPRRWRGLLAAGTALWIAGCAPGGVVSPAVPPDLKHSWEVAFNRGDADAIAALYATDGELIMPGTEPVRGRDAIRAAVVDMIHSGVKLEIGSEQNVGTSEVAYVYGPYRVADAAGHVVERGRYVETWRKHDGRWQIAVDINTAGPAAASPADGGSPAPK